MGLTSWKNGPDGLIYKYDVSIAKNYLNEEELNRLNDLTNIFIVFAEDEAKERHIMTMQDWIEATDNLLKFRRNGEKIKDCYVLGTPYIAILGKKFDGENIEVEETKSGKKMNVNINEISKLFKHK